VLVSTVAWMDWVKARKNLKSWLILIQVRLIMEGN
jgi:hypothetical protein